MATEIPPMGGSPQKGLFTAALTQIRNWGNRKISLAKENVKLSETVEKVEKSFLRALFEEVFFEGKFAQKISEHSLTILPSEEETLETFDGVQDLSEKNLKLGADSSVKEEPEKKPLRTFEEVQDLSKKILESGEVSSVKEEPEKKPLRTFEEVQDLSKKILGFGEVSSVKEEAGEKRLETFDEEQDLSKKILESGEDSSVKKEAGEKRLETFDEEQDLSKKILGFGEVSSVNMETGKIQKEDRYFTSADIEAKFSEAQKSNPRTREEIEQYKNKVFELYDIISHIFSYNEKSRDELEDRFKREFPGFLEPIKSVNLVTMPPFLQWYFLQQATVSHLKELLKDNTFEKTSAQYLRIQLMLVSKDFTYGMDLDTVLLLEAQLKKDNESILDKKQREEMEMILLCKKNFSALYEQDCLKKQRICEKYPEQRTEQEGWLKVRGEECLKQEGAAREKISELISSDLERRKFCNSSDWYPAVTSLKKRFPICSIGLFFFKVLLIRLRHEHKRFS